MPVTGEFSSLGVTFSAVGGVSFFGGTRYYHPNMYGGTYAGSLPLSRSPTVNVGVFSPEGGSFSFLRSTPLGGN